MFFFTLPEGKSVEKDPPKKKGKEYPALGMSACPHGRRGCFGTPDGSVLNGFHG